MQASGAVPLQPPAAQAVYGLNIRNMRLAILTKRVLTMAALSAILVIVGQVVGIIISGDKSFHAIGAGLLAMCYRLDNWLFMSGYMVAWLFCLPLTAVRLFCGDFYQIVTCVLAVTSMACGVLVPCCGYFGVKNSSRELTRCFCGCNYFLSVVNVVNLLLAFLGYIGFKYLVNECAPSWIPSVCYIQFTRSKVLSWAHICTNLGHPVDTPEQCWQYCHDTVLPSLKTASIITLACCTLSFILQRFSFFWGKQLYDALQEGQVIHAAPRTPVMAPLPVQPLVAMPAQPVNPMPGRQMR